MAKSKKSRKQKKRRNIKSEQLIIKTVNSLVDGLSPAIYAPAYKNFKYNLITKTKGSALVPISCITSCCSMPNQSNNLQQPKCKQYQPPKIETTHIFDYGSTNKIKRRKSPGNCTVIVPPNCLQSNLVKQPIKAINNKHPKPITLEKAVNIISPIKYRRRKRRITGASIVPLSCITNLNSVVKTYNHPRQKKYFYPPPIAHKPSPPILGPGHFKRRNKKYGDNNVIVPSDCIIQPKPLSQASSYDWRNAFPKPIALEKVADIQLPTIKIRTKKRYNHSNSFVPASCIIVPKEVPSPEIKPAVDEPTMQEAEAVALEQNVPTTNSDNNLYLLVVAVIVAIVMLAIVFGR